MGRVVPFSRPTPPEQWLSKRQAAEYLAVTTRTIERWQSECGLPMHRAGSMCRYKASELDQWVTSQASSSTPLES